MEVSDTIVTKKRSIEDEHKHHEELVNGIAQQLKPILDSSEQPIMIYLDDMHKTCNKKFANLFGYSSPKAWSKTESNFVETFIDEESRDTVVNNYHDVIVEKLSASVISAKIKKKSGETAEMTMIHVPVTYNGHLFAVGFISEVK